MESCHKEVLNASVTLPMVFEAGLLIFPFAPGWGASLLAIQMAALLKRKKNEIRQKNYFILWIFLTLGGFLTTLFSPYPIDSLIGILNVAPFFLSFIIFSSLLHNVECLERLTWLLFAPSVLVSILGLNNLWYGWSTPSWVRQFVGSSLRQNISDSARFTSIFMNSNIAAAYLVIVVFLGLGLFVKTVSKVESPSSFWITCFLAMTLAIDGIALILTQSRNAWGVAWIGCLVYVLYLGIPYVKELMIGFGLAMSGAAFGQFSGQQYLRKIIPYYFWGRLSDQIANVRDVEILRLTQWRFVCQMIYERPLIGWGFRSFTPHYERAVNYWLGHPHNLYLMMMSEIGVPLAFLLFFSIGFVYTQGVLLLQKISFKNDSIILFGYLVAFAGISVFNICDVTILDLRLNFLAWLILSGIFGQKKLPTHE